MLKNWRKYEQINKRRKVFLKKKVFIRNYLIKYKKKLYIQIVPSNIDYFSKKYL